MDDNYLSGSKRSAFQWRLPAILDRNLWPCIWRFFSFRFLFFKDLLYVPGACPSTPAQF